MGSNDKKISLIKIEAFLRLFACLAHILAAVVVVLDSQTKLLFGGSLKQTANYKLATIAKMFVNIHFIGAGYSLIQFVRCLAFTSHQEKKFSLSSHVLQWGYFLLDQVTVYMVFVTNCATTQTAFLVLTGSEVFQWMKLCNKFSRFCVHFGGGIFCGLVAFMLFVVISGISAFNLFRWYSPNSLCLKPNKVIGLQSKRFERLQEVY